MQYLTDKEIKEIIAIIKKELKNDPITAANVILSLTEVVLREVSVLTKNNAIKYFYQTWAEEKATLDSFKRTIEKTYFTWDLKIKDMNVTVFGGGYFNSKTEAIAEIKRNHSKAEITKLKETTIKKRFVVKKGK